MALLGQDYEGGVVLAHETTGKGKRTHLIGLLFLYLRDTVWSCRVLLLR